MTNRSDKTFVITGASKGLGEALVASIIENTKDLVISISRKLAESQKNYSPSRFQFIECDLSLNGILRNVSSIKNQALQGDIIFLNNASIITPIAHVGEFGERQIEDLISTNIKSPIVLSNFLLGHFKDRKITIINISSGAADKPIKSWSLYCSSKASIKMFFDVLKEEYPNFRFESVDPGVIDTDMQSHIRDSKFERVSDFVDLKNRNELKSPREVADKIILGLI